MKNFRITGVALTTDEMIAAISLINFALTYDDDLSERERRTGKNVWSVLKSAKLSALAGKETLT